jgi:hypothetical protein
MNKIQVQYKINNNVKSSSKNKVSLNRGNLRVNL